MATVNVSNSLVHSTGAYCLSAGSGGSHMLVHTDYVCIPTLCTSGTANFNNLTVSGNLTVQGTTTTLNTTTCTTSAMSITNAGTGPALVVNQTGSQPILDFQDDGTSSLYIEDGGYVGVGTNNPNQKLHVHNGRIAVTDGYNIGDTDANTGMFVSSDYFYIQTAGTTRLQVADNGKVGIGGAPTYTLDVNGDVRAQSDLYVGTGGGHFYNDSGSRVRINQDFYTNNSNTYIYGDNTYLGANSANDVIHTRDNQFRTRCIRAFSSCGLQFFDDSGTEYMRLWDGGTVSTGSATAGAFQLQNDSLSKSYYDNHPGAYYHAPSMIIRKDSSCTALCGIPASLVLYNNNGTCNTGTKLVFASREVAGGGNPVATAAIISRNVGGVSGSWACGDLAIMTKNRCTYCPAMCFDRLGRSYFQQDCTDWVGSNTYLRSANEFSFLNGGNAQNARFKGIQVSDTYNGTVPNCGILFGTDTCLLRSGSGQLTLCNCSSTSTILCIRSSDAGYAMVRAGLSVDGSQATGAFEVTQDGSYGGGISYNGDASPTFASGETADHVTFYNLNAGTRTEVFHYAYNSTTVNFNATPTVGGSSVWHAGNDGSGSGLDADLLDGQHGNHYLCRVATASTLTSSCDLNCISANQGWYKWSSSNPSNSPATYGWMLHICDASQAHQLIQSYGGATNKVRLFGRRKTNGNWDTSWTEYWSNANDGSGSGLDADTVDNLHGTQFLRQDVSTTKVGNLDFTTQNACLTLSNYGRIGIGLTNPVNPFSLNLQDDSTFTSGLVFVKNSGNRGTRGHGSGSALFQYCFSDCAGMILNKDGNVGIAESTPLAKLHIRTATGTDTAGNINSHIMFDVADDGGPAWAMRLGDTADDGDFNLDRRNGGSWANVMSLNRSDGRTTLAGQLCMTQASCTGGNIKFSAANPYICASSYIIMPGGLYVSGGTPYFQNRSMHRGGICNDSLGYLTINGGTGCDTYFPGQIGIGTTDPGSCCLQVQGESKIVGKLHVTAAINLCNSNLCNANHITINDPGTYEGLAWNSTAGNWVIDVSPLGRTNADGNLNFYNTGSNNIALWRPQLWVYSASCYATGTANSDGSLTITSTNTGADIFSIEGSNGTLFSVADDLSDSLMSVNDAAGLPVLEVFADSSVCAGRYSCSDFYIASGGNIGIGTDSPDANHDLTIANNANYGIRFTGTNSTIQANANLIETAANMIYLRAGSSYCTMIDTGCGLAINSGCLNMCSKNIHYVNELHFHDNIRFCGNGNCNYICLCSGCASNVRLALGTQTTGRGSLYANSGNCVGILDEGGDWAIIHYNNSYTAFRDSGGTERLCIGTAQVKSNEPICINANWNDGTEPEQLTIQGCFPSLALRSTNAGSGNANLLHVNSSGNLDFYSTPTTCGASSDGWSKRACISTAGNFWAQNNIYAGSSGALRQVTGGYGSIEVDGGATNSWEGFNIGGRSVFMHDNSCTSGLYNDVNDEWLVCAYHNGAVSLFYDGSRKFCTTSSGACVIGTLEASLVGAASCAHMVTGSAFATTGSPGSVLEYQQASGQTDTKLAPTTDWYNTIRMGHGNPYTYYSNTIAMQMTGTGAGQIRTQLIANNNAAGWRTVWDNVNDGAGSGLDADLLDGQHGSYYQNASNLNAGTFPDLFNCCTRYNIGFIDGVGSSNRDKLRVYNSSSYTIGMQSGVHFGNLSDWAMTFQMNDENDRGFWWGDTGHTTSQGAMSLTTQGYLTVAERIRVGAGQSCTSGPGYQLQVDGCAYISSHVYMPAYVYHIGDTNTYYGFSGSDCWRVVTGGSERIKVGNSEFTVNESGLNSDFRVEAQCNGYMGNKAYAIYVDASAGAVGIGTSQPSYALEVNGTAFVTGTFSAGTKNFLIDHPTRENYMLRHGSLEGPENAVYVRGTTTSSSIELPEYWTGLVDEDSITATLTPRGKYLQLFLDRVEDNEIHVGGTEIGELYDYVVYGTRKDVEDLVVEFERPVGS